MMNNEKVTFLGKVINTYNETKNNWKDAVKRKVYFNRIFSFFGKLLRAFILIGLSFVILLPILQKIVFAFRDISDVSNPQVVWITENYSLMNFIIAFKLLDYKTALFTTFMLSTVTMIIQIMATAVAGYSFARLKFKGNNIIFLFLLLTLIIPNDSLHLARTLFFGQNKFIGVTLVGGIWSIFIMSAFGMGLRSAIFIYLFRQFFRNIPVELEESAQVDGAGVIRTFWSVMLPNARGAIITVGLFSFVWQWNDLYFAGLFKLNNNYSLLSTKLDGYERLDTVLSTYTKAFEYAGLDFGGTITGNTLFYSLIANTSALLMMLPLLIGFMFAQNLFIESIERTGIVG